MSQEAEVLEVDLFARNAERHELPLEVAHHLWRAADVYVFRRDTETRAFDIACVDVSERTLPNRDDTQIQVAVCEREEFVDVVRLLWSLGAVVQVDLPVVVPER